MKDTIKLSDHFTNGRLLRFTFPSIVMMVFTSIYGVVDGFFISNYVNSTGFAAVNLILPFIMILSTVGFMLGTGGSALVGKFLGEGKNDQAKRIFSLLVYTIIITGIIFTVVAEIFLRKVAIMLGATDAMLEYCVEYGRIGLLSLTPFMLQTSFQALMVTAEKPKLGLFVTVLAGCANMILDFVFVGGLGWGVGGAAFATAISECIGGLVPLVYFIMPNKSLLRLTAPEKDIRFLASASANGASELMTNFSMSFVNMIYNIQLLRFIGEDGVAAYGVIMYVGFVFVAVFIGYSMGSAPLVSFNYGAANTSELKNIFKKSIRIIAVFAVAMLVAAELSSGLVSGIFVGYDEDLMVLTKHAFMLYSLSYLLAGFNIYASAFFTALNNGLISALISFSRVLLFQVTSVLLLPLVLDTDGIWLSMFAAEIPSLIIAVICLRKYRNRYEYY